MGCKSFIHLLSDEIRSEVRQEISTDLSPKAHFCSWLIDGSQAAKRKLTYEAELMYIRTAPGCVAKIEMYDYISMEAYVSVNAENLYHAPLRSLISLFNPEFISDESTPNYLEAEMKKYAEQVIGAGADGAAVNFGKRIWLLTKWSTLLEWLTKVHCFSHRMELAGGDALREAYGDIDQFLTIFYLHFRNSSKEWCGLQKIAANEGMILVSIPKPYGTRFVPHQHAALYAMRMNWVPLTIFFSNKR